MDGLINGLVHIWFVLKQLMRSCKLFLCISLGLTGPFADVLLTKVIPHNNGKS